MAKENSAGERDLINYPENVDLFDNSNNSLI